MNTRRARIRRDGVDEPAVETPSAAASVPVAAVLAAQRSAGNQAVARALAGRRTLSPWRDFEAARGAPQFDYKIFQGRHDTAGPYHIKFHNHDHLGVFNEIHVVFESRHPMAYFFYTDAGAPIPAKSSGINNHPDLVALAQELVDAQLQTSQPVPDDQVAQRREHSHAHESRDADVSADNREQIQAQSQAYANKQVVTRENAVSSTDEAVHMKYFLDDIGLGDGELSAFQAHVDQGVPARGYWAAQAKWYSDNRKLGWQYADVRQKQPKQPRQKELIASLPPGTIFKSLDSVRTKKGNQHNPAEEWKVTVNVSFPNYTSYSAYPNVKKPDRV